VKGLVNSFWEATGEIFFAIITLDEMRVLDA